MMEEKVEFVKEHYEQMGYRVHSGLQFGAELVLYADRPDLVHSDFCINVTRDDEFIDWREMQTLVRSMPDLHKTLVLVNANAAKVIDKDAMDSKSLNAGAYVFTPGGSNDDSNNEKSVPSTGTTTGTDTIEAGTGAPLRDSLTEIVEGIDKVKIEDAHAGATPTSDVTAPPPLPNNAPAAKTALPSHLAKHAAEFWFPECRDCSCCKGFKYGCNCAASNGGSCACVSEDDVPAVAAPPNNANSHQQQRYPSTGSGRGSHSHSHGGGRGGGGGGGRRKVPCRFFFTAQGCRFGDSCTFDHTSQG